MSIVLLSALPKKLQIIPPVPTKLPIGLFSRRTRLIGSENAFRIGPQARVALEGGDYRPFFIVCAHAGLKTGEDGPTHADPQPLQLLQDNFPLGTMITLTPWDPQELWFLVGAALARRPAIIAPFVTRPPETVLDRVALGLPPASSAAQGVCRLRTARGKSSGTIVLQGTGVTNAFLAGALPLLDREKIALNVYAITSTELFNLLPSDERDRIFPEAHQQEAMGITDFTLATMTTKFPRQARKNPAIFTRSQHFSNFALTLTLHVQPNS